MGLIPIVACNNECTYILQVPMKIMVWPISLVAYFLPFLGGAELFGFFSPFCFLFLGVHFNGICSIFEYEPLIVDGICNSLVLELFM